ncbi:MAG: cytochrome C [Thiohalocapsa sp.]|nr:cytochrome C [Thiohalocapsa sp.]MCF7989155.1 cytochrome C [Thiohalocapsa sp.]
MKRPHRVALVLCSACVLPCSAALALEPVEQLGKSIFFDKQLSLKKNQSCASCHTPRAGWTGPTAGVNKKGSVYPGSVRQESGNRKPPSAAYATQAPILHYVVEDGDALFIGGNFWDGRATGEKLGNPAADQAQGPFLNPVEQALPDPACVVYRVCEPAGGTPYPVGLDAVYPGSCAIDWPANADRTCGAGRMLSLADSDRAKVDAAYDSIALAIAAYEASPEVNAFSSKYDAYVAGEAALTLLEQRGLALFDEALCSACHLLDPQENGEPALLTDYTFDNLGVPKNPQNPVYDSDPDFVDLGLGAFLATRPDYAAFADANMGKQKVPTLRNVDQRPGRGFTKAYMHNGYFKTLEGVVHFYNTRDIKPRCEDFGITDATESQALANGCWPAPEVAANVNADELGNLGLSAADEAAIVAFMKTLSDGYVQKPRQGRRGR